MPAAPPEPGAGPTVTPLDVVVLGDVNPDLVLTGKLEPVFSQVEQLVDGADLVIGGSGAIAACGLARLGLRTAIVGVIGDDTFGHFMLDELAGRGVDTTGCSTAADRPTGVSVILSRGDDRAILTASGTIADLTTDMVDPTMVARSRHAHVSSYYLQSQLHPGLPGLLADLREQGLTISLDPNWDPTEEWTGIIELLQLVDSFLPNAQEACAITGLADVEAAAEMLAAAGPAVAVKLGAEGGLLCADGKTWRCAGSPIDVVDTTGAGDSFDAGFLAGRLMGSTLEDSLALAVACGSLSTRGSGGTGAQATLAEALEHAGVAS